MFVVLKRSNGSPIWVNPATVSHVVPYGVKQSKITFVYNSESVGDMYAVIVDHEPAEAVKLLNP